MLQKRKAKQKRLKVNLRSKVRLKATQTPSPGIDIWYLYVLLCNDASLYTGISKNPLRRYFLHSLGRGAKYTRSRGVKEIIHLEAFANHKEAAVRESEIKKLTRPQKNKFFEIE